MSDHEIQPLEAIRSQFVYKLGLGHSSSRQGITLYLRTIITSLKALLQIWYLIYIGIILLIN